MKNLFLGLISIVLIASLSNCKKEDDEVSFEVKINDYSFTASPIGTVIKDASINKQRIDIQGVDSKYRVNIAFQVDGLDDCVPTRKYTERDVLFMITYLEGNRTVVYHFPDFDTVEINVTSCENNVVSGTFSGDLIKSGGPASVPDTLKLRNGVFNNVKYNASF
jgi:hypothetical protein